MMSASDDQSEPSDDVGKIYSGAPKGPITDSMKKLLPKRFYKTASVAVDQEQDASIAILLDGRSVKTPGKRPLRLPSRALADAIALEWQAQVETINPATMPLTRFCNTAIDSVAHSAAAVAADIVAYAGSDLVCYRAAAPHELVCLQSAAWDPVIAWAGRELDAGDIYIWNEFLRKVGWNDPVSEILTRRKKESGLEALEDIQTMIEYFEYDEGRKS